ncbi:MAG: GAF domain-containing sensor histidine kinase [Bacteriovoracaceae bacterium]|nr:GAF domain-containing sensor histidine kinase [Bacteriovoracaceae bacterium]
MKIGNQPDTKDCKARIEDPKRLAALKELETLTSGQIEALDRLVKLASELLNLPLTFVTFVGTDKQYFKSFHGLPEPWKSDPQTSIDDSICRFTLKGEILALEDVREQPLLAGNPILPKLGLVAYLGVPLTTQDGQNLGAFCAVDSKRRKWSEKEINILRELANSAMSEIMLKASLEKLQKEQKDKEELISLLAHDIRSPLSTALASAELIEMYLDDKESVFEESQRIMRSISWANELIENFLDTKRIDFRKQENKDFKQIEIVGFIKRCLSDLRPLYKHKIILESSIESLNVWIIEQSLRRVLTNLIDNAFKHGFSDTDVKVKIEKINHTFFKFSVNNKGPVISKKELKQLFKPYYQNEQQTERGWGLGLALVKSVISVHQGDVNVESDQDHGTTFTITIPFHQLKKTVH